MISNCIKKVFEGRNIEGFFLNIFNDCLNYFNNSNNEITSAFFEIRDRREGIIERPTSTNNRKVLKVIFEIIAEKKLRRDQYRQFYTKINFIGKRKNLPAMDEANLKKIFLDNL